MSVSAPLAAIRAQHPLLHCISNIVSANDCANLALAIGASPIMAQAPQEMADIAALASAVVLNTGTPDEAKFTAARTAGADRRADAVPDACRGVYAYRRAFLPGACMDARTGYPPLQGVLCPLGAGAEGRTDRRAPAEQGALCRLYRRVSSARLRQTRSGSGPPHLRRCAGGSERRRFEAGPVCKHSFRFGQKALSVEVLSVADNVGKADAAAMYRETTDKTL